MLEASLILSLSAQLFLIRESRTWLMSDTHPCLVCKSIAIDRALLQETGGDIATDKCDISRVEGKEWFLANRGRG